jgi:transposase-like protein
MSEASVSIKEKGFEIFRSGRIRRLTPTQFLIPNNADNGSYLIEIQDGKWLCDCNPQVEECEHRFAAQLACATIRASIGETEERTLKCRFCGSPDVSACGYRYNAYGISKRMRCNECLRKFSIKQTTRGDYQGIPSETIWLLSEIGMVLNKLENLIENLSRAVK